MQNEPLLPGIDIEPVRVFTQHIAMPRHERIARLQEAFIKLHETNGLTRHQELVIMEALDALP